MEEEDIEEALEKVSPKDDGGEIGGVGSPQNWLSRQATRRVLTGFGISFAF